MILILGATNFQDKNMIKKFLGDLNPALTIMHHGSDGAETLAAQAAHELGRPQTCYKGNVFEANVALELKPDLVACFHDSIKDDPEMEWLLSHLKVNNVVTVIIEGGKIREWTA